MAKYAETLSERLEYYISRWRQEVSKLEFRWVRESQHSAESWAPRPPVEHQENEKDTTLMAIRVGVNILQSLFSLQLSLTHKTFQIKWEIYFFKVFARLYHCIFIPCVYMYSAWICIYIVVLYEYTTYWTSPGGTTPQGNNFTATCLLSRKLSKLDEADMQDTAGEARTSS